MIFYNISLAGIQSCVCFFISYFKVGVTQKVKVEWTDDDLSTIIQLRAENETWEQISEYFQQRYPDYNINPEKVRGFYRRNNKPKKQSDASHSQERIIHADGSHSSTTLLKMNDEQSKDTRYLLKAHGFNPAEFELISAKNSKWNHHNKNDGTIELYSSKISVRPRNSHLDVDTIIANLNKVNPVVISKSNIQSDYYLSIPLFDMHFGINTLDDYTPTLKKIINFINSNQYKEILITVGSDMFHHNDLRNHTASGREIEHCDMTKAWQDAQTFFHEVIIASLKKSNKVHLVYIKGNHDEALSYGFSKMLEAKYPDLISDTDIEERKIKLLGNNFIGFTHGDKSNKKQYPSLFATEFAYEWSQATCRELYIGHLHHESVIDTNGMTIRQLPTKAKTDKWHRENGYTMAHKRFKLLTYTKESVDNIQYI